MLILTLVAFGLYVFAPDKYSLPFCSIILILYLVTAVYVRTKDKSSDFPSFHFLFSLSFLGVHFIYPVLVYPIVPDISLFALHSYSYDIISKCTALAYLAYCLYGWGYVYQLSKNESGIVETNVQIPRRKLNKVCNWTVIVFAVLLMSGGFAFFANQYQGEHTGDVSFITKYLLVALPSFLVLLSIFYKYTNSKYIRRKIFIVIIGISGILVLSGTRTIPLLALLMFGYIFSSTHKINKIYIIIAMIGGILFMSIIGEIRHTSIGMSSIVDIESIDKGIGYINKISDLFINNRNLYAAVDIVNESGPTYGVSLLGNVLSPIPFLQSVVSFIFGIPSTHMGSASFLTEKELGAQSTLGLGTSVVADTYLAFGLLGLLMFIGLGRIIVYSRHMMNKCNIKWSIVYISLLGDSIYLSRSSILGDFRVILWAFVICYFFKIFDCVKVNSNEILIEL